MNAKPRTFNDDIGSTSNTQTTSPSRIKDTEGSPGIPERRNGSTYGIPDDYTNLNELEASSPIENANNADVFQHRSLEEPRRQVLEYERNEGESQNRSPSEENGKNNNLAVSKSATHLYTVSYLILFSFLGTLARLGLQTITFYPGAPVIFSELWANFGGSLFMGFLIEDRMLFREEWGGPTYHQQPEKVKQQGRDEGNQASKHIIDVQAAKKAHTAVKKTIPLYIGLATGFCGCFTSFSTFIRDAYLALSNDLPTPSASTIHRNGGYSFMAVPAVIITTVSLCMSGLYIGAHVAIATQQYMPSIPFKLGRKFLDPISVFLAWGCWIGAIFLAIFPPDRSNGLSEIWRGRAVFAMVFAPLGCLGRFYASLYINRKIVSFPLGTFLVNILGTAILGMSYDLQHVPLGGVVGCQILQGIEDGFCGCLTTVSTWVGELSSLGRRHAYRYGAASVAIALCFMVVIMGSMQWTRGFEPLLCKH